jgi:hypothetical protein
VRSRGCTPLWLLGLLTGQAWLRVAPVGPAARQRVERVVVGLPQQVNTPRRLALPPAGGPTGPSTDGYQTVTAAPDLPTENPERAAVLRLVEDAQTDGCRRWRGSFDEDGYPRAWWEGHGDGAHGASPAC